MTDTMSETETTLNLPPDDPNPDTDPDESPLEESPEAEPTEQPPDESDPAGPDDRQGEPSEDDEDTIARLKELDKKERALEKRADTYARAVYDFITESEQPFIRCECCLPGLPGFLVSPVVSAPSEAQVKFARALAGMPDAPPLVQAADARMCPACEGWGEVLTGSRRNDQNKMKCQTCGGRGFVSDRPYVNGTTDAPTFDVGPVALEQAPEDTGDTDPWGRPKEHPGYMILPHAGLDPALMPPNWQT